MSNYTCVLACAGAAAFFGGMLYVSLNPVKNDKLNTFLALLNPQQRVIYSDLTRERMQIYLMGLILGLLVGFIFLYQSGAAGMMRSCGFVFIALSITYLFYMLYPKSTYMLYHLTTDDQRSAWMEIYKTMQYRHYMGMVLGIIAYALVSMV